MKEGGSRLHTQVDEQEERLVSRKQSTGLSQNLVSLIRKAAVQLEHDGRASLAIRLLKQLLKDGDSHLPVAEKARLRATLGGMVWKRGSVEKAHALAADALSLAEECDDPLALSEALFVLGEVTYIEAAYMGWGDLDTAMTYHQRCLKIIRSDFPSLSKGTNRT